ncbi:hypothetical protein BC835DRAFT_393057 [Cytidiella melzeri]|nr:hypothetical protein BC835DRAFT_393057 [Cytidiella melzeri]
MKLSVVALFSLSLAPVALSFSTSGAQWSNAKRMANGLPPLRPRKLYNGNVARAPAPSQVLVIPPSLPTSAGVSARVVQVYTQNTTPVRRQTVGASAGYLNQVAKLTSTNGNVKFSLTTDTEVAQGLYPTDYQQPTASTPISEFICLSNGHSADQTRTQPITLSPDTGDYLYLADCGADLDRTYLSPLHTHCHLPSSALTEPKLLSLYRTRRLAPCQQPIRRRATVLRRNACMAGRPCDRPNHVSLCEPRRVRSLRTGACDVRLPRERGGVVHRGVLD